MNISLSHSGGILVKYSGKKFSLDPKSAEKADYIFVSHAHSDHLHRASNSEKIISSNETVELASLRGYEMKNVEKVEGVELLDSGHILGSRCINIDDEVIYTGDIAGRERGFMRRPRLKHAEVLIIETTYGSPEYVFPPTAFIVKEVNRLISSCYDKGYPVVLMGYTVGKAQLLSYFFSSWKPLYIHESVERINSVYRKNGVKLPEAPSLDDYMMNNLPRGPWVMISPLRSSRNRFIRILKKKYNAVTVSFSGWALEKEYRVRIGSDYAFPLSDHSDFKELLEIVSEVSPRVVYTTHGFAEKFARILRNEGFDSKPISSYQSTLQDHLKED